MHQQPAPRQVPPLQQQHETTPEQFLVSGYLFEIIYLSHVTNKICFLHSAHGMSEGQVVISHVE